MNTGGGYGEAIALLLLRNYRRISYECSTTVNHGPVNGNGLEVVRARSRLVLSISKSPGRASLRRRLEKPWYAVHRLQCGVFKVNWEDIFRHLTLA